MMAEEEEDQRYQKDLRRKVAEAMRRAQAEQQKKELMRQFLDAGAYERLMNIKVSNPELYEQLVGLIISLAQSNRLSGKMTEDQLRSILGKITYRKEPTIEFKHK
jgi:programmed cell death protein 5